MKLGNFKVNIFRYFHTKFPVYSFKIFELMRMVRSLMEAKFVYTWSMSHSSFYRVFFANIVNCSFQHGSFSGLASVRFSYVVCPSPTLHLLSLPLSLLVCGRHVGQVWLPPSSSLPPWSYVHVLVIHVCQNGKLNLYSNIQMFLSHTTSHMR